VTPGSIGPALTVAGAVASGSSGLVATGFPDATGGSGSGFGFGATGTGSGSMIGSIRGRIRPVSIARSAWLAKIAGFTDGASINRQSDTLGVLLQGRY
jgi:hypothetical protein